MKKHRIHALLALLLSCALLLPTLVACGGEEGYDMKPSTDEELAAIMTIGGEDVPYELFRAFFLTNASLLEEDTPIETVWEKVLPDVLTDVSRVYAIFELAEKYGIDPYGKDVEKTLQKRIKIGIDGGTISGMQIDGYGSYDKYLEAIEKNYLTDSASRLILRYQICEEMLLEALTISEKTQFQYTDADLLALYESEDCRAVELMHGSSEYLPLDELLTLTRENMLPRLHSATTAEERLNICMQYFHAEPSDAFITPYAFSVEQGAELLTAAFALDIGDISEPIPVYTATGEYVYLVRRQEKKADGFSANKKAIEDLYLRDRFYRELAEMEKSLLSSVHYQSLFYQKQNQPIRFGVQ